MKKTVVELFAGVGGFRVGLNKVHNLDKNGIAIEKKRFKFVWANQWEPSTSAQYAYLCYKQRFNCKPTELSNQDITTVDKKYIPDHSLLCGGFPCQDYSVARSLKNEQGIRGKKGVLWWEINDILIHKKPPFVLLENVDRLLIAPSKQRGQAFGIMLRCFYEQGYSVEWRVINAANYSFPQRRRRVFIFAFKNSTNYAESIFNNSVYDNFYKNGLFAKKFLIKDFSDSNISEINIAKYKDLVDVSENFAASFENSGFMINGNIYTVKTKPKQYALAKLANIIDSNPSEELFLNELNKSKFEYLRGSKKVLRVRKSDGGKYYYSEGSMKPYDSLDLPGRTMLTSEGTVSRSSHIILDPKKNALRFLSPIECERMNQFPDNWTNTMNNRKRYFMMGNALVCGIVSKLGDEIFKIISKED